MQATELLERKRELELIDQLLVRGSTRLLTLTGPAGVGKTSLALEVGTCFARAFPNRIRFVDLTSIHDLTDIGFLLVEDVGLADFAPSLDSTSVGECAEPADTLLILDNFEHLLSAAYLVEVLLARSPRLRVLVTSREVLRLRAEQTLAVPPLSMPDLGRMPSLPSLGQVASVALFVQRARMIDAGFRLSEQNARSVAELCVRLDGLPLAIELAAARTRVLTPDMLLERIDGPLPLLRWQTPDLPPRHRTLCAAIAWSYDLLSSQEQTLFRKLAVFVGGFTLPAAEAILAPNADGTTDVLEILASLVDKSLVQSDDDGMRGHRFRMLESVRDFVVAQSVDSDEPGVLRRAHAVYFLDLAERAAPELAGRAQREWYLRLEQEHGNLRAALQWLQSTGEAESALRLVSALAQFWEVRGYLREGGRALEGALTHAPEADAGLRARVLTQLGSIQLSAGDSDSPRRVLP
jgi:predicted ATPase